MNNIHGHRSPVNLIGSRDSEPEILVPTGMGIHREGEFAWMSTYREQVKKLGFKELNDESLTQEELKNFIRYLCESMEYLRAELLAENATLKDTIKMLRMELRTQCYRNDKLSGKIP